MICNHQESDDNRNGLGIWIIDINNIIDFPARPQESISVVIARDTS
jgi:hypothetical protein